MSTKAVTQRGLGIATALFVAASATFIQAYLAVKLAMLVLVLIAGTLNVLYHRRVFFSVWLVAFYAALSGIGVLGALVGLFHQGNYTEAVFDMLRLYVIWSVAFTILFTLLRSGDSLEHIHTGFVWAGLLISGMNFVGLADQFFGLGIIPESVRLQLELYVGIHDGYVQITTTNIGALFVVVPYLLALQFRSDAAKTNSILTRVSLLLSLVLVALCGRRALWVIIAIIPCLILVLALVTGAFAQLGARSRRLLGFYCAFVVLMGASVAMIPESVQDAGYIRYLKSAFSSQDQRAIQKGFLVDRFAEEPLLGTGWGAYAGYIRSHERPWSYELTYHQLLMNLGIVGGGCLGALILVYFLRVAVILRRHTSNAAIPFALLVGFVSLLVGSYSNPYLSSFDFRFLAGLLPYLATFGAGFYELAAPRNGSGEFAPVPSKLTRFDEAPATAY